MMNEKRVSSGRFRPSDRKNEPPRHRRAPSPERAAFAVGCAALATVTLLALRGYSPSAEYSLAPIEDAARDSLAKNDAVAVFLELDPGSEPPGLTSSGDWDLRQYLKDIVSGLF